jgi:hypothetical protein
MPRGLRKKVIAVYLDEDMLIALREVSRRRHIPQQYFVREGLRHELNKPENRQVLREPA